MSYISARDKLFSYANILEALTSNEFDEVMEELKGTKYLVEPFCHQHMEHDIGVRFEKTEAGHVISIASYVYDEVENEVCPIKLTHTFLVEEDE